MRIPPTFLVIPATGPESHNDNIEVIIMALQRAPVAYSYDGTFNGFLCCVFAAFAEKRIPEALIRPHSEQAVLYPVIDIETDEARALRVSKGICAKISEDLFEMLQDALLCETDAVDLAALEVACLGFDVGPDVVNMLTVPCVSRMMNALRHAWGEAHLLKGFVRFREFGGAMIATVAPKNRALSLIAPHFVERFAKETFMIYDEVHKEALVHQRGRTGIYPIEHYEPPQFSDPEQHIASLWQQYFKAIKIQARENPTCQRSHMPKRYWAHMIEMKDDVCYNGAIQQPGLEGYHGPDLSPQAHAGRAEGGALLQGAAHQISGR